MRNAVFDTNPFAGVRLSLGLVMLFVPSGWVAANLRCARDSGLVRLFAGSGAQVLADAGYQGPQHGERRCGDHTPDSAVASPDAEKA